MDLQSMQEMLADMLRQLQVERGRVDERVAWSESFEAEVYELQDKMTRTIAQVQERVRNLDDQHWGHARDHRSHPNA